MAAPAVPEATPRFMASLGPAFGVRDVVFWRSGLRAGFFFSTFFSISSTFLTDTSVLVYFFSWKIFPVRNMLARVTENTSSRLQRTAAKRSTERLNIFLKNLLMFTLSNNPSWIPFALKQVQGSRMTFWGPHSACAAMETFLMPAKLHMSITCTSTPVSASLSAMTTASLSGFFDRDCFKISCKLAKST